MTITVLVHPNNRHPRIEEDLTGQLHVYVNAPPLEGKANLAVIESLAEYFKVKKRNIHIQSGHSAKLKRIEIDT